MKSTFQFFCFTRFAQRERLDSQIRTTMLFNVFTSPRKARPSTFVRPLLLAIVLGAAALPAFGNTTGIATTGDPVRVKDNGDGTVTMSNGIVSILLEPAQNRLNSIQYTSSNSGAPRTTEILQKHEHYRWGGTPLGGSAFRLLAGGRSCYQRRQLWRPHAA